MLSEFGQDNFRSAELIRMAEIRKVLALRET